MGRNLEFDRTKALTKATELFWKQGYVNTSLKELLKTMKMGEGSFYNTFKGKKALYLECLQHYDAVLMERRLQIFESDRSTKARVYDFFEAITEDVETRKIPGCLVSNSLTREVLAEKELRKYLFSGFERFQGFLTKLVARGIEEGDFRDSLDPATTGRVLMTYIHGMHRLSRFNFDGDRQREEVRAFLDAVLL